jgi:hypothetical protein
VDASWRDLARRCLDAGATLLAHQPADRAEPAFNPAAEARVSRGDRLFYVAATRLDPAVLSG